MLEVVEMVGLASDRELASPALCEEVVEEPDLEGECAGYSWCTSERDGIGCVLPGPRSTRRPFLLLLRGGEDPFRAAARSAGLTCILRGRLPGALKAECDTVGRLGRYAGSDGLLLRGCCSTDTGNVFERSVGRSGARAGSFSFAVSSLRCIRKPSTPCGRCGRIGTDLPDTRVSPAAVLTCTGGAEVDRSGTERAARPSWTWYAVSDTCSSMLGACDCHSLLSGQPVFP